MAKILSPAHRPLTLPKSSRRVLRRPDLRHLTVPRLSGAPLTAGEIDHDELIIHRAWRSFEPSAPGEVRYFMYELSQKNPGQAEFTTFFKAVRMCRLTRVPRYLRQQTGDGPGSIFQQQHNLLAALREQQVLFINMIAKSPKLPLIFGYGVQAVGSTPEEAQTKADEAYAVLTYQLDGTYQQLEYAPIKLEEGELLSRYQSEWNNIAMARGRPMPAGGHVGASSMLDGNRSDVEQTNNQLESFIRGMSDTARGGFMLSLVTVPLSPVEITTAWRNISQKLSAVRSDTDGSRSVMAGVALPLAMGHSTGDTHGNSHSIGSGEGVGASQSVSQSQAEAVSQSFTEGVSESYTEGVSQSFTEGVSESFTEGASQSVSQSESVAMSESLTDSTSASTSAGESIGTTDSVGRSLSASESVGASQSMAVGESQQASLSHGVGTSQGQSLSAGQSVGQSWNNSLSESLGSSLSQTQGHSTSQANSLSQTLGLTNTQGDGTSNGVSQGTGSDVRGGLFGFGGGGSVQHGTNFGANQSNSDAIALSQTGSGSSTQGVSNSLAQGLSQSLGRSESFGGNLGQSLSSTQSAGTSENISQGQSIGSSQSHGVGASQSASLGQSLSTGQSLAQAQSLTESAGVSRAAGVAASQGQSVGASQGVSQAATQGTSQSATQGQSQSATQGVSQSATAGASSTQTAGASQAASQQQSLSDAYMVAMSRQASTTGSLGVVPNIGISISKVTRDEAKRVVGDILDAQMRRYLDGIEGGAFLYQMFLVAEDAETLAGGAGLLKSSFWGPGNDGRVAQPFHVITDFGDGDEGAAERQRLLSHAAAFTSYRRREPVMEVIEPFLYSSYITPGEAAAFCHPPTSEAIGLLAVHDSMPVLAMPANRGDRDINLGHVVNGERGRVSSQRFGIDIDELTHTLITGVTGQGKALALDTPVPTPDGWTTMAALKVGDTVLDDNGHPTRVSFVTDTMHDHDCYRVTFSDGTTITADAEHLWQVTTRNTRAALSKARRRSEGVTSTQARRYEATAARLRSAATDNVGVLATLGDIAERFDDVTYNRAARLVREHGITPVAVIERTTVQYYGDRQVTKARHVKLHDTAQVLGLAAESFEAAAGAVSPNATEVVLTTAEMARVVRIGADSRSNFAVRNAAPLELDPVDLDIDPYLLGAWLGDGASAGTRLYIDPSDIEIIDEIRARGYDVRHDGGINWTVIDRDWQAALDKARVLYAEGWSFQSCARMSGADPMTIANRARAQGWVGADGNTRRYTGPVASKATKLHTKLRSLGVLNDKHIPALYLRASVDQRLALLRGLMDTDGTINESGNCEIELTRETLVRQILELVRSLGIAANFHEGRATLDGQDCGPTWCVSFTTDLPVFALSRKAARVPAEVRPTNRYRYITDITPAASVPVRCIQVDAPSHLYLAGEAMVPTHNTTTLMSLLAGATQVTRTLVDEPTEQNPFPDVREIPSSILGLDWMPNMRNLGSIVEPVRIDPATGEKTGRFQLFSIAKPELGAFTWNVLAVPDDSMSPSDWLNAQCDNFVAAMNLGEFGRSLLAEFLDDLYRANRLKDYVLMPARVDEDGREIRAARTLPALDPATLPPEAIKTGPDGEPLANVYTCAALSRCIGVAHLAILVAAKVEELADPNAARLYGTAMRDRLQSLWRRMSYYAPGGHLSSMLTFDESLDERRTLGVRDIVDPDKGLVTIIETDGLDIANRRLVLGSVLLAVYRYGQHHGPGTFDHGGRSAGLWCVLEEAHELFGEQGEDEDSFSASTRTALFEAMHRRIRAMGVRLIDVVQNPATIPAAITGNTSTVFIHRTYERDDRERVFSLLNWTNMLGSNIREFKYLGEMARGFCIVRLDAKENFLESAPVQIKVEPASLGAVTDAGLANIAKTRGF